MKCQTYALCPICSSVYDITDIDALYLNAKNAQRHAQRMMTICDKITAFNSYEIQSAELPAADTGEGADTQQETVAFHESDTGAQEGFSVYDNTLVAAEAINDNTLSEFLSRPVRIANFTWLETDSIGTQIFSMNPWGLFFQDTRIQNKLHNFAYIRCNLKIKIMLNASPFYYGSCIAAWQPLHNFTPSTIVNDGSSRYLMPISQRPHTWLLPQENVGSEMTLPFLYHKNWIQAKNAFEFNNMGRLDFIPYTLLQSANGAVGTGVTIQVYAWAEDVTLSGMTTALAVQSDEYIIQSDEYGTGAVSRPASYVAGIASRLTGIPIIGKWATATQMGASAVSSIAKLFGFTNVPVIEDVKPYRPTAMPQMASTEIGYPVEKLTIDAKNELSIDPSVLGLPSYDELSMTYLLSKDSYLARIDWSSTAAVDTQLWQTRVNPNMFSTGGNTNNSLIYFTPMAYVGNFFEYWRGDIIFRFDFMTSAYHKGRVRVSWDPQGSSTLNITNSVDTNNVVKTEIVDLALGTSLEMRIPYNQALPYLMLPTAYAVADIPFSGTPSYAFQEGIDNGMLNMRVLNALTAPVATSSISILVSVRGAENLEYAGPTVPNSAMSDFIVQSEETVVTPTISTRLGNSTDSQDNCRTLINFGESIYSFRPLMRRLAYSHALAMSVPSTGLTRLTYAFHKLPPFTGFDPAGQYNATGIVGVGTFPYNVASTTAMQWILPCFIGYRGSVQWHFNPHTPVGEVPHMSVTREPQAPSNNSITQVTTALSLTSMSVNARALDSNMPNSQAGQALTNTFIQTGLSVQVPNYTNYLFQSTAPGNATAPPTTANRDDGSRFDKYKFNMTGSNSRMNISANAMLGVEVYCGAGTDFSPIFFLNCPVKYRQTSAPPAV